MNIRQPGSKIFSFLGAECTRTTNENYSFSWKGRGLLCLNKKLVEKVVTGSLFFSAAYSINSYQRLNSVTLLNVGIGLLGTYTIEGLNGCIFSMLFGSFFQPQHTIYLNFFLPHMVGQGLLLLGILGALSFCLSLLVKSYGSVYLNEKLDHFNYDQNRVTQGMVDRGNILRYEINKMSFRFSSLKPFFFLSLIPLTFLVYEFYKYISIEGYMPDYLKSSLFLLGAVSSYKLLDRYVYIIPFLVLLRYINNLGTFENYARFGRVCQNLLAVIGIDVLLIGTSIKVLDCLMNIAKQSGNDKRVKHLMQYLIDKKTAAAYKKSLEDQKSLLEKKERQILNSSLETIPDPFAYHYEEIPISKPKPEKIKREKTTKKAEVIRKHCKKLDRQNTKPIKLDRIDYEVNLNQSEDAWNKLFSITKSQPDQFVMKDKEVESLITALGGEVRPGSKKKFNIYFNRKKYGYYEVAHRSDRHKITSDFAQNIKDAIEDALNDGNISEKVVKIKKNIN